MQRGLAVLLVAACGSKSEAPPAHPAPATTGIDLAGMAREIKPGDDFFMYANGGWFTRTEIPQEVARWGAGPALVERTNRQVAEVIRGAGGAPGSEERKVRDFYAAVMDEAGIAARGLAPVQPMLDKIAAIHDATSLAAALGDTVRADVDAINATNFDTPNLFGLWVAQDLDEPARYAAFLLQGGLAMPDRDYYLSPAMASYREKYEAHVAAMFALAKLPDGPARAKRVVDLETKLARAHATRTENVDVKRGDNHWALADFPRKAPGLDWPAFFAAAGLAGQSQLVVWQPAATAGIAAAVDSEPLATWKDYLTAHVLDAYAQVLPGPVSDTWFAFFGTTLTGVTAQHERWHRAVEATNAALGDAVGKLYVTKYFSPADKQRAQKLVEQLIAAFGRRIDNLGWMAPETKAKAKAKLATLRIGVGYPDAWRDYRGLEIAADDAVGNADRAARFEYKHALARLGKPVDRGEWVLAAQVVDAVNCPAMNAMNFPAAILGAPFFDPARPEVMDYGAIGAIIGHEVSHSFDDQGALFDASGKLANWWSKDDFAHFSASSQKLVAQYDAYKALPDLAVNGKLTLSENIADTAGLAVAYDAYRAAYGGKEAPTIDGLTGDQQFFVSFAQAWRNKYREPALRRQLLNDGHSPAEYRADTVRNLDPWYAAFGVAAGEKLYLAPVDRVHMW